MLAANLLVTLKFCPSFVGIKRLYFVVLVIIIIIIITAAALLMVVVDMLTSLQFTPVIVKLFMLLTYLYLKQYFSFFSFQLICGDAEMM